MKTKQLLLTLAMMLMVSAFGVKAQVESDPSPLQEDSKDIWIYYHADQGNKGLANLGPETKIYAHTGVITSDSKSDSDWKYAPNWGDNNEKYELTYVSPNLWKLYIGDIYQYYGITNPSEKIKKLAFVFRTADTKKEGKGEGNTDIFVDVHASGLQIEMLDGLSSTILTAANSKVHFKVGTTKKADIRLQVGQEEIAKVSGSTLLEADYTFTSPGNYIVTAYATADGETKNYSRQYTYIKASQYKAYPGGTPKMGPVENSDGSVTFCLAAPGKTSVMLVGAWDGFATTEDHIMYRHEKDGLSYFWMTVKGIDRKAPYPYYFLIDGNTKVGDPYARLVLDPSNDKYIPKDVYPDLPAYPSQDVSNVWLGVYQGNINDYDWKVKDFKGVSKDNLIIYELLLRDFTGTEGKAAGNGTIRKAIEKLPYLIDLGVNAIELLPINEFNGNNSWGYNPNFYFAPDKAYGTPDDYKEFIDLCHQNGIAVILDMVFNQSDWQHPWYRMYPVGSNPFYNATAPHAYSVLNDWNQGHPLVREQWRDVVKYWLTEYNVDGFRFDLVKGLGNNESYPNNGDSGTNAFNQSRIDNMHAIQLAMEEVKPGAYFINENLAGAEEENAMAKFGQLNWSNINNNGCQYAMGYQASSSLNGFYAPYYGRDWGSTVSYLESHDEERLAYKQEKYGADAVVSDHTLATQRLGSAAAQMIMAPGAHMIWQFSEMGNAQTTKNSDGGNNVSPKIVNWNLLNDPANKGLVDDYRALIALRKNNPELFAQNAEFSSETVLGYWKQGRKMISRTGDKELYTVINPNVDKSAAITIDLPIRKNASEYEVLYTGHDGNAVYSNGKVTLSANSFAVIGSKNVVEVNEVEVSDRALDIILDGECIEVLGDADMQVYSLSGACLYNGPACRLSLGKGVFVVRSAGHSAKVVL